jgi:hypothetical protein
VTAVAGVTEFRCLVDENPPPATPRLPAGATIPRQPASRQPPQGSGGYLAWEMAPHNGTKRAGKGPSPTQSRRRSGGAGAFAGKSGLGLGLGRGGWRAGERAGGEAGGRGGWGAGIFLGGRCGLGVGRLVVWGWAVMLPGQLRSLQGNRGNRPPGRMGSVQPAGARLGQARALMRRTTEPMRLAAAEIPLLVRHRKKIF